MIAVLSKKVKFRPVVNCRKVTNVSVYTRAKINTIPPVCATENSNIKKQVYLQDLNIVK